MILWMQDARGLRSHARTRRSRGMILTAASPRTPGHRLRRGTTKYFTYASLRIAEEFILFSLVFFAAVTLAGRRNRHPAAAFAQTPTAPVHPPAGRAAAHHQHHRNGLRAALGKLNVEAPPKAQLATVFAQAKQQRQATARRPATVKPTVSGFPARRSTASLTPAQAHASSRALQQRGAHRHNHRRALASPGSGSRPPLECWRRTREHFSFTRRRAPLRADRTCFDERRRSAV